MSVINCSQLMMYREIIAVCSEIYTKHINALWAEYNALGEKNVPSRTQTDS